MQTINEAANSIDTPEFRNLLYACYGEFYGFSKQDALIAHINAWGDSRCAATPAQPIADMSAPTDERAAVPRKLADMVREACDPEDFGVPAQWAARAHEYAKWFAARAAAPVSGPSDASKPIDQQLARFAIDGAICHGRTGFNKPPTDDHWLMEYWQIGQQLAKLGETCAWDNVTPVDSAAPVSGQGASCGDDPEFWRLAKNFEQAKTQKDANALIAYIDSRPRSEDSRIGELEAARIAYASEFPLNADGEPDVGNIHANIRALKAKLVSSEDSRAGVLKEAAKICFDRVEEFQAKLDNCDRDKLEAVRADALPRRDEASKCAHLIRALASTAARSFPQSVPVSAPKASDSDNGSPAAEKAGGLSPSAGLSEADITKLAQYGAEVLIMQKNATIKAHQSVLADRDAEIAKLRATAAADPTGAGAEAGWQPIETAPKGAKGYAWMALKWADREVTNTGAGMRCGDRFFAAATFYCFGQEKLYEFREVEVSPTHWMPMPDSSVHDSPTAADAGDLSAAPGRSGKLADDEWVHEDMARDETAAVVNLPRKDLKAAYVGAREDLAIWKRRALECEESCRRMTVALNAENGPTFMGEPATSPADSSSDTFGALRAALAAALPVLKSHARNLMGDDVDMRNVSVVANAIEALSPADSSSTLEAEWNQLMDALGCEDTHSALIKIAKLEQADSSSAAPSDLTRDAIEAQLDATLRPVEQEALKCSIRELDDWLAGACDSPITPSQGESILLVLHELKRLRAVAAPSPTGESLSAQPDDAEEMMRRICQHFGWRTDGKSALLADRIRHHVKTMKGCIKAHESVLADRDAELAQVKANSDDISAYLGAMTKTATELRAALATPRQTEDVAVQPTGEAQVWIPVTERMPEDYREVYAKNVDGRFRIARHSKKSGGCWQLACFGSGEKSLWSDHEVTHWCILSHYAAPRQPEDALTIQEVWLAIDGAEGFSGSKAEVLHTLSVLAKASDECEEGKCCQTEDGSGVSAAVHPEWVSEVCGPTVDDLTYGQGYRAGFNDCRNKWIAAAAPAPGAAK